MTFTKGLVFTLGFVSGAGFVMIAGWPFTLAVFYPLVY